MAEIDYTEAEARQLAFDESLDRIRDEGAQAFADGIGRIHNPYSSHPESHFANAWTGGWAEASLGIWTPSKSLEEREEEARELLSLVPR